MASRRRARNRREQQSVRGNRGIALWLLMRDAMQGRTRRQDLEVPRTQRSRAQGRARPPSTTYASVTQAPRRCVACVSHPHGTVSWRRRQSSFVHALVAESALTHRPRTGPAPSWMRPRRLQCALGGGLEVNTNVGPVNFLKGSQMIAHGSTAKASSV